MSTAPYGLVAQVVQEAVEGGALPASFARLLIIPLRQPGKVLAGGTRPLWSAIVFGGCAGSGGDERAAVQVAAAVELFIAGLDVLDEIEDDDDSPLVAEAGVAQALNASTALLMLAHEQLARLDEWGVPAARVPLFTRALAAAGLAATGGQHHDLAAEGQPDLTIEAALDIARRKAGTLVGGACRLGATLGTDDEGLLGRYEAWGRHFGTASQLANDLHDAERASGKSDLRRAKGTLPLIYARRGAGAGQGTIAAAPPTEQELVAGGALHFTWVVLQLERQACAAVLEQLADRGQSVARLRGLLDSRSG